MTSSYLEFSVGDWVVLSAEGAKAHREYHRTTLLAGGAAAGAVLLPLALPGAFLATVGIASGGAGLGVGAAAQVTAGAAGGAGLFSFITNYLENHPEAQAIGVVRQKKGRWWNQPGHDYEVVWSDANPFGESSWHLDVHLQKIEAPQDFVEINIE